MAARWGKAGVFEGSVESKNADGIRICSTGNKVELTDGRWALACNRLVFIGGSGMSINAMSIKCYRLRNRTHTQVHARRARLVNG